MRVYELRNGGLKQVTVLLDITKLLNFIANRLQGIIIDIISAIVAKIWIIYQICRRPFDIILSVLSWNLIHYDEIFLKDPCTKL